tara:strand:- start:296 stop:676 length:381 start_codon:yes stop_codon:yes gene_type:complete
MAYNRPQYNNNYQKKNYNNNYRSNSVDSNGGTAKLTTTKKDGCILVVTLNNQNLVLKGYYQGKTNEWKLFPYYDKRKQNPSFNQPKQSVQSHHELDDNLPSHMKDFQDSPTSEPEFDPEKYEQELG